MHCQWEPCRRVVQRKGDYLFGLKENHPSLPRDVRLYFDGAGTEDLDSFQAVEKNVGRIEKRICHKIRDISWLKEHKWPGLRSVFSIERSVAIRGHFSTQTSYYISSRDVCAEKLVELAREHWKIESMHWLLDVTFSEDDSRLLCDYANRTKIWPHLSTVKYGNSTLTDLAPSLYPFSPTVQYLLYSYRIIYKASQILLTFAFSWNIIYFITL